MASENLPVSTPTPAPSSPPREAVEHQDQSIKVRKSQLFEPTKHVEGPVIKPLAEYLKTAPPDPLTPGVKAALWTAGVVVVLLFLAALILGRETRPRGRRAERPADRPAMVTAVAAVAGGWTATLP
jgi:hypothetical protein